jgi:hypothetical protein
VAMFRSVRRVLVLFSAVTILSATLIPIANGAQWVLRVSTTNDTFNSSTVDPSYDLEKLEIGLSDDNLDTLYIWMHFKNPIRANQFVDSANSPRTPWAMALLWRAKPSDMGGNAQDFRIEANDATAYPTGTGTISAIASGNTSSGGTRSSLTSCQPKTWSDISQGAKWIGFSISRSCAKIPDVFYISGYTDNDSRSTAADSGHDWAPEDSFLINLNNRTTPIPNVSGSPAPTPSASPTIVTRRSQSFSMDPVVSQALINRNAILYTRSDSGLRVVRSTTPVVCQVYNTNSDFTSNAVTISLISEGSCTLEGYAPSTNLYFESQRSYLSFQVTRTGQEIDVTVPDKTRAGKTIDLDVLTTGDNYPILRVTTPKICTQPSKGNPYRLKLLKVGTCRFELFDAGSNDYLPYDDMWEFDVIAAAGAAPKPTPSPKKTISGSASTTKNPSVTPSNKPNTSTKIGGTADTRKP